MNNPFIDYAYNHTLSAEDRADLLEKIANGDPLNENQAWFAGLFRHAVSPAELVSLVEDAALAVELHELEADDDSPTG